MIFFVVEKSHGIEYGPTNHCVKFELKIIRIPSFTRRNVRFCIVKPFSSPKDKSAFILHSIFRHCTDYRNRSFQYFCMKFSQIV